MMIDTGLDTTEEITETEAKDLPGEVIVSDPVEPVSESTTSTPDVHTMTLEQAQKVAQDAFNEKLKAAEDDYMEASLYVKDLQERLKKAKKEQKEALDYVWDLKLEGPAIPTSLPDPDKVALTETEFSEDTTWREITMLEVIDGIEGLGTKKRQALLEAFENFGQLEDARSKASTQHKPFKDILPDGLGETVAQKLDDRISEVWAQHRKKLMSGKTPEEKRSKGKIVVSADDVIATDPETVRSDVQDAESVVESEPVVEEDFESDADLL